MQKALRTTLALLAMTAAIAAPAYPQQSAKPQESPWAMRAPAAVPQGAPTLSAQQQAARAAAEKGTPEQQAFAHKVADAMSLEGLRRDEGSCIAPSTMKCIGKNQDFLQDRIKRQFELPISRKFKLKITKLPPNITAPVEICDLPDAADSSDGNGLHRSTTAITTPSTSRSARKTAIGTRRSHVRTEAGMVRFAKLQHMRRCDTNARKRRCRRSRIPSSRSCSR